jgi:excisionase family DNA binding protein
MKPRSEQSYLTTGEVAARLRIRPRIVRWLIRTRKLTAQRISGELLIEETDLTAFIVANTYPALFDWEEGEM